jgi:carbamoyltransferase
MAGGVALNCVANGRLLREGPFEDIWIQPAAGDAGGALGAALAAWHRYFNQDRETPKSCSGDLQKGSYLGPSFSNEFVENFLEARGYPFHLLDAQNRAQLVAKEIAGGKIVGYFSGRMEYGPRALGARSILGDPRREDTQTVMNLKIKFRESFRPFAPTVLADRVDEYFKLDRPSPYMLLVAGVKESRRLPQPKNGNAGVLDRLHIKRSDIPAVTHLDYSARVQTVSREVKPDYYDVIREFAALTGCPVVVNTSFNVRGEPIICTPQDAYRCFMRTEMDTLVMEDCILYKSEQPKWEERDDWREELILD